MLGVGGGGGGGVRRGEEKGTGVNGGEWGGGEV